MRASRPRFPHSRDIDFVRVILQRNIALDTPLKEGWRYSLKNVPNYRLESRSRRVQWTVDVYAGMHLVITIGDRYTQICKSVPSMVSFLRRMLRV